MTTILHPMDITPAELFKAFADKPYTLFLDSADTHHPDARYSYIMASPAEILEANGNTVTCTNKYGQSQYEGNPLDILNERLAHHAITKAPEKHLPPFQGGAAGLFGYDLGRTLEKLPATAKTDKDMPDMAIGIYTQVYAYDHQKKQGWLITHEEDRARAKVRQEWFLRFIENQNTQKETTAQETDLNWQSNFTRESYIGAIRRTIEYIHAGDIFQANLAQRFEAELPAAFDAAAHYLHLRKSNPAPFASYFDLGNIKIASSSPERFLTVQNGKVTTKPIKGTRPRSAEEQQDKQNAKDLLNSKKDRAENIMIVDLLRNDISRTCKPESVHVEKLCGLESFASVHHLVSTITGELQDNKTSIDLLKTCFPGGSITGAPKIRAMEIIEELEGLRRGPYCGSIGYIGFDGTTDTNILIRTLIYKNNTVSLSAGGGIVADSNAEDEYQETLDKAEAMFKSFSVIPSEAEGPPSKSEEARSHRLRSGQDDIKRTA